MNAQTGQFAGEFDYIVVGAGSAGAVMAARLSDDTSKRVLLIEEGPRDESWYIRIPKGFGKLLSDPGHTSYHPTVHDSGNGTPEIWLRGKMLGGSSGLNGMVWNRGVQADYDALGSRAPGWSWQELLPYLRGIEDHELGETAAHGKDGPIPVRVHPERTPLHEALLAAGQAMGWKRLDDICGFDQEGIGYLQSNINAKGERVSAARGFLTPEVRDRANLTIATGTRVDRARFEDRRAIGVDCTAGGHRRFYRARAEVILCAGGLSTPKLLQLSGVGPGALLQSHGIAVVHDQPGVGANLREHRLLMQFFKLRQWGASYNRSFAGARLMAAMARFKLTGRGPMAYSSSEIGAFVTTEPALPRPNAQFMFSPYSFTVQNGQVVFDDFPGFQTYGFVLRPQSRGSLQIASADINVPARIDPNYLAEESDRKAAIEIVRTTRKLIGQVPLAAFVEGETGTTSGMQSDDEILDAYRRIGQSGYHACGTCRMGADAGSVVDPELRVRGVQGLRVMDCSIYPEIIAGNTNAPTMALAWRGADLILKSRGR